MFRTYLTKYTLLTLFVMFFFSCQPKKGNRGKQLITVSILPQKFFVEAIAGDLFEVNVMIPPGASPASYDPSAQQMVKYANSSIYFMIGSLGYEQAWKERLKSSAPDVRQIETEEAVSMIETQIECNHGDHTHFHGEMDPHVWTSPRNVILMVKKMCEVLTSIDPANKELFESRTEIFIEKIHRVDEQIAQDLKPFAGQTFLVFHPSLGYFANDYHLIQESIEFEGKSPSAAHMANVVDMAQSKSIQSVYIQAQFEIEKAEMIAQEIGASVVYIDPLSENWLNEISRISEQIKNGFSK